ncbi:SDR family NAD(P)-dependent oxidoreductase [Microvirga flavescens]|uniref:SDR family NAD(P)-dependent oxidoreductase n=1 Tax=Microvirga flavescens TaxID=2249811 RepID=UPI001FDFD05A|nr:SDR family NAD(P)-dependent oxidoreductase [Microvirga flavescens]
MTQPSGTVPGTMHMGGRPVAMISGASRGIGAAIAHRLVENGWAVSLGLRDPANAPLHGEAVLACRFDAEDPDSEAVWVSDTVARFGRLDGLVHNAGVMLPINVLDATDQDFARTFAINVRSPMRLTALAWPHLAKERPGRIVVMSSLSGKRIKSPSSGLYGMSKFALMGFAHALRQSGRDTGIRTTAICPSFVATDMSRDLTSQDPSLLTQPEDLARIVHMVLELPPTASIAEVPVHWTVEECF